MTASRPGQPPGPTTTVVFVGGGPRTVGLLERMAASAPEFGSTPLDLHIVDPYPPGGGRIWRRAQSPLLWMNSMTKDVTIFTDESVVCAGPVVPGPALDTWIRSEGRSRLLAAGLDWEADHLGPDDFASREVQSLYLAWAFERAVAALPPGTAVTWHSDRAVRVVESGARQQVTLAGGARLAADVIVLAQGYLDRELPPLERRLAGAAAAFGLTYVEPGYTADIDLSGLRPGETVLVNGLGLAYIDVQVLVNEGRGGRYLPTADGRLEYAPSGQEPVLYVGSRRGVPYHAKLGYALGTGAPVPPTFFTPAAVAQAVRTAGPGDGTVGFTDGLLPLIAKELAFAHYRELFAAHPERTSWDWTEFRALIDESDVLSEVFLAAAELAVPKLEDRFDLGRIDRPLAGLRFADRPAAEEAVVDHIRTDLRRRADPYFSADAAVFNALLTVYGVLAGAVVAGQISAQDRVQHIEGDFHGLFSFLASGPPPRRLQELLALHDAGLVHFLGPDVTIEVVDGVFEATSPAVPGGVRATALLEARLPRPDVRATTDPVIAGLLADGELAAEDLTADDGTPLGGGQLLADASCRAIRADRSVHPRRFLLGPSVSGSAGAAGFARPGFNGAGFRQNDLVARTILTQLTNLDEKENTDAR